MTTDYIRGVQAAEAEFLAMYGSADWSDQCSIGFASTFNQALFVLTEGADTHPPEPMLEALDRRLRKDNGELVVSVDKPTGVWSARINEESGGMYTYTALGPVSALVGVIDATRVRLRRL